MRSAWYKAVMYVLMSVCLAILEMGFQKSKYSVGGRKPMSGFIFVTDLSETGTVLAEGGNFWT